MVLVRISLLPSKNVLHSAKVASYLTRRAAEFGITASDAQVDMEGVYKRKKTMVEGLISLHVGRFRASGVDLIMGQAKFVGERTVNVRVNAGGSRDLTADKLFLSLGTRSAVPNIPGLAEDSPMTHVEALDLECRPEHLIVLGGGYIALELAQAFRRFGSKVTIIERGAQIASKEDAEVGEALLGLLQDEGVSALLSTALVKVRGVSGSKIEVDATGPSGSFSLQGTDLLIAAGRVPNTQDIGLEKLGVELDELGYIKVNQKLETTAPDVWAVGDCVGSPQFTHAAYDDFRVVRDNFLGSGAVRTTRDRLIPSRLFTDPELVRVGMNENNARRLGIPYRVARMPAAAILRTQTISEPRGFLKMLIAADSDRILGFTAFCTEASELLAAVQTAMAGNLPYIALRDTVYAHPTMAEGLVFLLSEVPAKVHSSAPSPVE